MSDIIHIAAKENMPEIQFDTIKGELSIAGKSYPENIIESYSKLTEAIQLYIRNNHKKTVVHFNWKYYNTATAKYIVKLIVDLNKCSSKIEVYWHCSLDFTMMIEKADLLSDVLDIPFKMVHK